MNETLKVSISGIGFIFDQPAYLELKAYLDRLEQQYQDDPDGREIIADIEARIVEIILSKQSIEEVVGSELVRSIIEQMGCPEEIKREAEAEKRPHEASAESFPRRLYRNPDGAKLGGVCNGLATFFDIDTVWVRLALFVPLVLLILLPTLHIYFLSGFLGALFGVFVLLYFILWFAIPQARTPRQKLEMKGERITAATIQQTFSQENTPARNERSRRSDSILAELFAIVGRIFKFGIMALLLLIGLVLAVCAVSIIVAICSLPFQIGGEIDLTLRALFFGLDGITPGTLIGLLAAIPLLPIIMLLYLIVGTIFKLRVHHSVMWILGCAWLVITAFCGITLLRNADRIRDNAQISYELWQEFCQDRHHRHTVVINGDTILHGDNHRRVRALQHKSQEAAPQLDSLEQARSLHIEISTETNRLNPHE